MRMMVGLALNKGENIIFGIDYAWSREKVDQSKHGDSVYHW